MTAFDLPPRTIVNKIIPKNAFDGHTNTKQKKKFSELVDRIRWVNKLSPETINLSGKEIQEIQVFEILLRKRDDITDLVEVINKAIPYPIIFYVSFGNKAYLCASKKHPHPVNENLSVIDWTFKSEWIDKNALNNRLNLKTSLDFIYKDFCSQLSSGLSKASTLNELVEFEHELTELRSKIVKVRGAIQRTRQFNKKVELNLELQELEARLKRIIK
jgi:hypothetical protein